LTIETFARRTHLPVPAATAFAWHERPGALARLTPPWARVELLEASGGIRDGARVVLRIGPLGQRWVAEHFGYVEGREFRDRQVSGPFARWEHRHLFEPDGDRACWLEDRVEYALPFGRIGHWLGRGLVRRELERTFAWRHRVTAEDLAGLPSDAHPSSRAAGTALLGRPEVRS
jgi:hypothetical protein